MSFHYELNTRKHQIKGRYVFSDSQKEQSSMVHGRATLLEHLLVSILKINSLCKTLNSGGGSSLGSPPGGCQGGLP